MSDRRRLPPVNELLAEAERAGLNHGVPRPVVVEAIRSVLAEARRGGGQQPALGWLHSVSQQIAARTRLSLQRVVNATGVVLHTNLGRAPLAPAARRAAEAAYGYSALEYDLDRGARGSRQDHVRDLLRELTTAEDALVVTNTAAAVLLLLNTLGADGETIVSRGELVEIGGSFRIPEILARSGSRLVEVGTTNRTRLSDYTKAITSQTRLLLKVHRSNFQMSGFVAEVLVEELAATARGKHLPVVHDAGSGLLIDLAEFGLRGEPLVEHSVAAGATVAFSGDKLVGGPQAGIIVGPKAVIAQATSNPMARALRPDKFALAALEATLALYRDPSRVTETVPVLAMLTADPAGLKRRARRLARRVGDAQLQAGVSAVGGGAFPGAELPTSLVTIETPSPEAFLAALREHDPPVIARTVDDRVAFDVRTLEDAEFPLVADAVAHARANRTGIV